MRRLLSVLRRPLVFVAALPLALLLTGCGGSSSGSTCPLPYISPSPSSTASPSPTFKCGDGPAPKVTGAFDTQPTLTQPKGKPSDKLVIKTLIQGTGAAVKKGDLVITDYVGQIWGTPPKELDNSYKRGVPADFPIGVGGVLPGFDQGLVGAKVGSRVILVIPPAAGYGPNGKTEAGVTGTDTLVFVIDVINTYAGNSRANGTPTFESLTGKPQVTGAVDAKPTITVPAGLTPPTAAQALVLAVGSGARIKANSLVVAQFVAVHWDNSAAGDTWASGFPSGLAVGIAATPSPFDQLIGVAVGSRILLIVPAATGQDPKTATLAGVIDIVGVEQSQGAK